MLSAPWLLFGLWWRRKGNYGQNLPDLCTHDCSLPIHITAIQTAQNISVTFSGSKTKVSENDEHLLLAQWYDLAPVHCGINGMKGQLLLWAPGFPPLCFSLLYIFWGNILCNCIPKLYFWVHSYRFLLYMCRIYVSPIIGTCVCGLVSEICAYDVCVWCSPIGKASPHHHQHHNLPPASPPQGQCNQTSPQEPDIMIAVECAN